MVINHYCESEFKVLFWFLVKCKLVVLIIKLLKL